MTLRFIDSIWHVRGSIPLVPHHSGKEAFARLAPLFDHPGTRHELTGDTLTFTKKDPAAQDSMSVFDSGTLRIEQGLVLRYHLVSRALLYCFLAPLAFLAFAQGLVAYDTYYKPHASAAAKAPQKKEKPPQLLPLNPIDKALGAPAPEKPKKDGKDGSEKDGNKHSPTSAYVFACIFAVLYAVGRVLEARLVRRLFTKALYADTSMEHLPSGKRSDSTPGQGSQLVRQ